MPCKISKSKDGYIRSIICTKRESYGKNRCHVCGSQAHYQCDVCDVWLCKYHAKAIGIDTDVCPEHDNEDGHCNAIQRRKKIYT